MSCVCFLVQNQAFLRKVTGSGGSVRRKAMIQAEGGPSLAQMQREPLELLRRFASQRAGPKRLVGRFWVWLSKLSNWGYAGFSLPVHLSGQPSLDPQMAARSKWQWLKIKELGLRRFWSMFPLTRAAHFGTGFLSHGHLGVVVKNRC